LRYVLPLLQSYAELLGWKLALDPELEAALAKTETGLRLGGEIARDDVHPLVQSLARAHGLCFRFDADPGDPQLRVESLASEHGKLAFQSPIAIPPELLPAWSHHPAFLLGVEIPLPSEGSAELAERLRALLGSCAQRTDLARTEAGALRLVGSAAVLEFVAGVLADGSRLAQGLESATFPPDPNTPAGKAAAVLPPSLRSAFPPREGSLSLHAGGAPPSELEIVLEYGRWAGRTLYLASDATRNALAKASSGHDVPASVPPAWAHEFVSGLLADSRCALTPLPAAHPVLWAVEIHPAGGAVALDPAGLPTIRLEELAAVAHLAATRFQTFVRLPKLEPAQLQPIRELVSSDTKAPFWITQLGDPQVFSVIGTPRAITSAVLALRLLLAPAKPR
jgi:hypothetical protein